MRVIETTLEDDLAVISGYLWSQGIAHRVFEERGRQVVEVADPAQADRARQLFDAWRTGRLQLVPAAAELRRAPAGGRMFRPILRYPALSLLVVLAVLVFPFSVGLGEGHLNVVAAALLIVDPAVPASPGALPHGWQVWRWLTPILLHFSIVHLAFNCAIVIDLGRRIEAACGAAAFGVVVVATGVVSNLAQFVTTGSVLFGGLSGVGYGLLGFLLVMARRFPGERRWRLPPGLAFGLLIFLVVFTTGITEPFGLHVANAAHWGGLVAGALLASRWPAGRARPDRDRPLSS